MAEPQDAVRIELGRRIAALGARSRKAAPADLARDLDEVRHLAQRNNMLPAVTVARLLDAQLARGEHGALVDGWLGLLADAVRCERDDAATSAAFAAACSVRLAG